MLDKRLLGVDENSRGYSSFFFNRNNTKDHCVIGQSNTIKIFRISVAIFLILVLILVMIMVPYSFFKYSYYEWIQENIQRESDQWCYMWATVVVLFLVEYFALFVDLYVIVYGLHEHSHFDDVKWYYFMGLMFVMSHLIVNFFSTIIAASWHNMMAKIKNNPILFSSQNHPVFIIHCIVIGGIVLALQLIVHHAYYIILAFIASPIHAFAFLSLYATGIGCLTVFVALFLKALIHPKRRCLLIFHVIVVIALLLFIYVSMQIVRFVGEYRNYGGIISSFIAELVPSVVLGVITYFGRKKLKCISAIQEDTNHMMVNNSSENGVASGSLVVLRRQETSV